MAAQDVRELIPRVRRAIEGPVPLTSGGLTNDQILAWTADALADIILLSVGAWPHALIVTGRDTDTNAPSEWAVDPEMRTDEETVVASQAALTYFFHEFKDGKVSEAITNEGQSWDWSKSATLLKDQFAMLREERDLALSALVRENPPLARFVSLLEVRDRLAAVHLEPWSYGGGLGGGYNDWLLPAP